MGIRRTLNKSLLLPISLLVLVASIGVGVFTFRSGSRELERRVQNLADSSVVLFEQLVWQYDHETLQFLLDEYIESGLASAVRVSTGARTTIKAGTVDSGTSSYVLTRDLRHAESGSIRTIGTLTLQMSRDSVWHTVRNNIIQTVLIALLAVLATALLIQYLLSRRLIAPVLSIANALESWNGDWHNFQIDLGRSRQIEKRDEDELDQLVQSIHGMRDQILSANRVIESKEVRLLSAARIAGIGYAAFELESGRIVECDENIAGMLDLAVEELLGFNVREEFIRSRVHPEDLDMALEVPELLAVDDAAECVFRVARATGEYRYIRCLYRVSSAVKGQARTVLIAAQDVTELYRLQARLVHAQKIRSIGNLTGGVAHDFNNILAVIAGNLELLDEKILDSPDRGYVQSSLRAVQIGGELTHQLLAFARKQPLQPEVLDLSRLIRDSLSLLRSSVGASIDLQVVADGGLWRTEVDKVQLEASILNLVINARDAMPDGGKLMIEVGNARLDRSYADQHEEVRSGQYVCVVITDTGCGMSMDTIEQALEPFFTTKEVGKGVGLGLPMAFGFAKQSGGHLKIYSELGRGTSIKLYLPRVYAKRETNSPQVLVPTVARYKGLNIFLVEDNVDLLETFTTQLENLGAVVHSASDGPSAFDLAVKVPHIDLIVCDVILPNGMKGPEVVKGLLEFYRDAAVIHMSGYTENAVIHHGRLDEGVIMLQKPFSRKDMMAAFAKAVKPAEMP